MRFRFFFFSLVKQAAEIEDLRQKLERAAEQADSLKWRLKEANDQIAVEKEKVEANNGQAVSLSNALNRSLIQ